MRILVTGAGRSSTNWTAAILRESNLKFCRTSEDRKILTSEWPPDYSCKLCTEWFTVNDLAAQLDKYEDLKVVLCMRHPVSTLISKLVRGKTDGTSRVPPDGTIDGAIEAIRHSFDVFTFLALAHQGRYMVTFLEELVMNLEEEIKLLAQFCKFSYGEKLLSAHSKTTNLYHQRRYGSKIDPEQAYLYKSWADYISGQDMRKVLLHFDDIMRTFDYEILPVSSTQR